MTVRKKHYVIILISVVFIILLVTLYIYYNINNAIASVDNKAGLTVPEKEPAYHFAMISGNIEDSFWL